MIKVLAVVFLFLFVGSCTSVDNKLNDKPLVQSENIKLVAPTLKEQNFFFTDSTRVSFFKTFTYSKVMYELNNSGYANYDKPFFINKSSQVSYFCLGSNFINSDTIIQKYYNTIDFIKFNIEGSTPSEPYINYGLTALTNTVKADFSFKSKEWIAFKDKVVKFKLTSQNDALNDGKIVLSFLNMQSSWIFKPAKISVEAIDENGNVLSKMVDTIDSKVISEDGFFYRTYQMEQPSLIYSLAIEQLDSLPSWHPGHGGQPWLFIDEIIVF